MNPWVIFAGLIIAAFCGAVIEHVRTSARYEFRIQQLHTTTSLRSSGMPNFTETLEAEHAEPVDVILDLLLDECPDESEVKSNG